MFRSKLAWGVWAIVLASIGGFIFSACFEPAPPSTQERSKELQQTIGTVAFEAVPPYQPQEFSIREDINWYLEETEGRHTWYTYALNYLGEPLFYVVSDMRPTNICVNITSSEEIVNIPQHPDLVVQAPSLNGVWRKGGACDTYFLRDVSTGAYIELSGSAFSLITSKQPLLLETDIVRLGGE